MRYYIASRFSRRTFLRDVRTALVWLGHKVTSTWLDEETDYDSLTQAQKREVAVRDYNQIKSSSALLLDAMDPLREGSGGGRENEFGFAQGIGICTVRIGPAHNPFHNLAELQFRNWDHFIEYIQREGEHKNERRKKG